MIKSFKSDTAEDLFNGIASKRDLRDPKALWKIVQRKLDMVNAAYQLTDLRVPPGNQLEKLKGKLAGYHGIRVNDQFRIVFIWEDQDVKNVDVTDYH